MRLIWHNISISLQEYTHKWELFCQQLEVIICLAYTEATKNWNYGFIYVKVNSH